MTMYARELSETSITLFVNREDYGFYIPACADNDEKMRDHARGMHIALAGVYKNPSVEAYCLDEIGEYRIIANFI